MSIAGPVSRRSSISFTRARARRSRSASTAPASCSFPTVVDLAGPRFVFSACLTRGERGAITFQVMARESLFLSLARYITHC